MHTLIILSCNSFLLIQVSFLFPKNTTCPFKVIFCKNLDLQEGKHMLFMFLTVGYFTYDLQFHVFPANGMTEFFR